VNFVDLPQNEKQRKLEIALGLKQWKRIKNVRYLEAQINWECKQIEHFLMPTNNGVEE